LTSGELRLDTRPFARALETMALTSCTDRLGAAGISDVGRQREHNEDQFVVAHGGRLVAVADGMGGHNAGEVASALAIESMLERFVPDGIESANVVSDRLGEEARPPRDGDDDRRGRVRARCGGDRSRR
jgi:hypothetical protein